MTNRRRKNYRLGAHIALVNQVGHPVLGYEAKRKTLTATLYVWGRMDPDNAVARLKWPIDCLVGHGLLRDDNGRWLDFTEIPKQVIDRKNPRVEIELVPSKEQTDD